MYFPEFSPFLPGSRYLYSIVHTVSMSSTCNASGSDRSEMFSFLSKPCLFNRHHPEAPASFVICGSACFTIPSRPHARSNRLASPNRLIPNLPPFALHYLSTEASQLLRGGIVRSPPVFILHVCLICVLDPLHTRSLPLDDLPLSPMRSIPHRAQAPGRQPAPINVFLRSPSSRGEAWSRTLLGSQETLEIGGVELEGFRRLLHQPHRARRRTTLITRLTSLLSPKSLRTRLPFPFDEVS